MQVKDSIFEFKKVIHQFKLHGKKIAFVPTMGALHEGHLSLIKIAKQHADLVVVSIYVNPEQFGPNEDFDKYPRTLENDLQQCEDAGVDLVFTPNNEVMYGSDKKYFSIELNTLNIEMDGGSRSRFFEGIVLVVNKLFNIVEPDFAVFGQKDIQQFRVISQMVKEFNHNVELIMAPISRAEDGLALSSRNMYLSEEERILAPSLFRSLSFIKKNIVDGIYNPSLLIKHQLEELKEKGFKNDYIGVYSMEDIQPIDKLVKGNTYILAGATYIGRTRLIDNLILEL